MTFEEWWEKESEGLDSVSAIILGALTRKAWNAAVEATDLIVWCNAPRWANYKAVDEDGGSYWYENNPSAETYCWYPEGGRFELFNRVERPIENWKDTLKVRPTK